MTAKSAYPYFLRIHFLRIAAGLAAWTLMASEYHGTVTTSGLPVPGVTVTAIQADKKMVTTTDEQGRFAFAELADGTWTLEVETLGFARLTREVFVAATAPPPQFSLKIQSEAELIAALEPSQQPSQQPSQPGPAIAPPAPRNAPAGAGGAPPRQAAFQRLNVNQSASTSAIGNDGAIKAEEIADLNQSAANSFLVQGSLSSAAGLPAAE